MNSIQQAAFIRELLNIPKDLKDFLALLIYKEATTETLIKLLSEQNKGVMLQDIKTLLDTNSKEAIGKLLKLFQANAGLSQNTEQLNKIVNLLNLVIPSPNASSQEILTKTLLLYLPWLPLFQQQNISLKFEEKQEEDSKQDKVVLIVYISTLNLGRFKVIIILNKNGQLNIDIECEERDNTELYLKQILDSLNQETKNHKIDCKTNIYKQKNRVEKEVEKRELSLFPMSDVSPKIILVAHSIAKVIFEIDEKITLVENRKEMIQ
jgi:hypothetical protein